MDVKVNFLIFLSALSNAAKDELHEQENKQSAKAAPGTAPALCEEDTLQPTLLPATHLRLSRRVPRRAQEGHLLQKGWLNSLLVTTM